MTVSPNVRVYQEMQEILGLNYSSRYQSRFVIKNCKCHILGEIKMVMQICILSHFLRLFMTLDHMTRPGTAALY